MNNVANHHYHPSSTAKIPTKKYSCTTIHILLNILIILKSNANIRN